MNRTQSKLRYSWLAFQLLPETFTVPELRSVYAAILDPALLRLNTGNFKKAFSPLFASGALVPVGRRAAGGRPGRPGDLYRFTGPVMGTWERELPWHEPTPTPFRHLMIGQDTGTAIVGAKRADIYVGSGEQSGRIAGGLKLQFAFANTRCGRACVADNMDDSRARKNFEPGAGK